MKINFFRPDCAHPPISKDSFGLCDLQNGLPAYIDIEDPDTWIATIRNEGFLPIVFTAIDKCVLQDGDLPGTGRCDGMLTTDRHLYLVELKDQKEDWISDAKDQLLSTIDLLLVNHDITHYRIKKAFACNKRRKKFAYSNKEENLALFRKTGFRIDVQAEILVV